MTACTSPFLDLDVFCGTIYLTTWPSLYLPSPRLKYCFTPVACFVRATSVFAGLFFCCCRKATEGLKLPFGGGDGLDGSVAATIFAVTDSLPSKSVGEAVQTITEKEIKSEVEVSKNSKYVHFVTSPARTIFLRLLSIVSSFSA